MLKIGKFYLGTQVGLLFMVVIFLISCQPRDDMNERLFPEKCELPCWRSIKVGETTEDELLQIVELASIQYSDVDYHEGSDFAQYVWSDREVNAIVGVSIKENIIEDISMVTNTPVTLEDAFDAFGPPDTYVASVVGGGGAGSLHVEFYYEQSGIILSKFILPYVPSDEEITSCSIRIMSDFVVQRVYFVTPGSAKEMTNAIREPIFSEPKTWSGFGNVGLTACDYKVP